MYLEAQILQVFLNLIGWGIVLFWVSVISLALGLALIQFFKNGCKYLKP